MTVPRFRFAPSPNGELHLGHAYSALLNRKLADASGGEMLLRIEDIDTARCTPQFERGIYHDLEWLGVAWDGPVRRQSEHFVDYADALGKLRSGGFVYPAFMSRGEIRAFILNFEAGGKNWPRDPDGAPHYPDADRERDVRDSQRRMDAGEPFAWRLDMRRALAAVGDGLQWTEFSHDGNRMISAHPENWGDVIVARNDIPTSYHLSVVVDDALQGVTHVVRGRDLYEATSVQRVLQTLLDLPQPIYRHHDLILGADGRKLSKSERSTGLRALREAGVTPDEIAHMTGCSL